MTPEQKSIKILIAEDEPFISKMYQTKFEIEGALVLVASNGADALEIAKHEKLDIILSDIIMPKMDGLKMLEEIRLAGLQIPVIMLTNIGQDDAVRKALALGAKDYLIKADATPEVIWKKINATLAR